MSTREEGLARSRKVTGALVTASVLGVGAIAVTQWDAHATTTTAAAALSTGTSASTGSTQSVSPGQVSGSSGSTTHATSGGS